MKIYLRVTFITLMISFSTTGKAQRCSNYNNSRTTGITYQSIKDDLHSKFIWRNTAWGRKKE